jgi:kynurenine formamidase
MFAKIFDLTASFYLSFLLCCLAASLDPGSCGDFLAHRIILSAGIYGIENINAEIDHLPPNGATIMAMPLKLTGGSGSPSRVVAFVPNSTV